MLNPYEVFGFSPVIVPEVAELLKLGTKSVPLTLMTYSVISLYPFSTFEESKFQLKVTEFFEMSTFKKLETGKVGTP